jgi:hypothetical protein
MTSPIAPRQTRRSPSVGILILGVVLLLAGVAAAVVLAAVPGLRGAPGNADGAWQGGLIWVCALAVGVGLVLVIVGAAKRARWRRSRDD